VSEGLWGGRFPEASTAGLLLRGGELDGRRRADIRVSGGRVTQVAPGLRRRPGEAVYDCRGGAVLPGLCDHHVHLHALAARDVSVRCGPPEVYDPPGLAAALAGAAPDPGGWIRGVGYAESVAGDLDAAALDRMRGDRPVRVQHRSGALWMLNSAALTAIGAAGSSGGGLGAGRVGAERGPDGGLTGRFWRADAWLRSRLPPTLPPALDGVGARLLGHGITAVTDATPGLDAAAVAAITDAMSTGALPQRVWLLGAPLGLVLPGDEGGAGPAAGPYKIVLADSGLPGLDDLAGRIRAAHAAGRSVAVHCVTREALVLLVAALRQAGTRPGDRIEHAALVPAELLPALAGLGVRVVTQPGFLTDRGDDFLRDVDPRDRDDLYRCGSLLRAGIGVALSSDAPYGPLDPWAVINAAVRRRTASGQVAGPGEAITLARALDAYLAPPGDPGGPPRRVRPGLAADLVVLRAPLARVPGLARPVRAVLIDGAIRWDTLALTTGVM
jgi:predicted amidohydrolase YtcJ